MSLSIPATHLLSFSKALAPPDDPLFLASLSGLSLLPPPRKSIGICMGGGPRTYPGGVSKWQWKRMQDKKAKQLLKARLCRERQIYEMRKRAELKAAVADLERPWEVVERAPKLFSVNADEQVKVLADRFQRPGGFDLWTDRDGPQLFQTPDGIPSARFFPKGVVHSVKPYGKIEGYGELESDSEKENGDGQVSDVGYNLGKENGITGKLMSSRGNMSNNKLSNEGIDFEYGRKGSRRRSLPSGQNGTDQGEKYVGAFPPRRYGSDDKMNRTHTRVVKGDDRINRTYESRDGSGNKINRTHTRVINGDDRINRTYESRDGSGNKKNRTRTRVVNGDERTNRTYERINRTYERTNRSYETINRRGSRYSKGDLKTEVYDMSLQADGSYSFQPKNGKSDF